ncbi:ATP-binding protein [Undibacterium cyanobacteriorum]|uniref:histidine kinase n=1 Tax=Undibacterium cyanobacteriorum TaxID=3073561 RepID=A0ABY9REP2_9BURK|nr:ATP-binding protein [Undibacterium sp. 20NA77.5]WMW79134.1 ATP-binding protein [Undibacterium sp. 20NA77.5]
MHSFRLHAFIATMILTLLMLALSFLITRTQLVDYEQARLENRLCMELKRLTKRRLDQDEIERIWKDMSQKLHLTQKHDLAFSSNLIESPEMMWLSKTPNWIEHEPSSASKFNQNRTNSTAKKTCKIQTTLIADKEWIEAQTEGDFGKASILVNRDAALQDVHIVMTKTTLQLLAIFVVLATIGSLLLARLISRPVLRLQASMQSIDKDDLHSRLSSNKEFTEFQSVIHSYNQMLDRLEQSFQHASRFAANAAHELRTPLTILTVKLERAINHPNDDQHKQELSAMLDEVSRLASITQKLLFLAQAEAGTFPRQFGLINLSRLIGELVADLEMLDESALISPHIEAQIDIEADPILIRQLLSNLLTNAIRYCEREKAISVELSTHKDLCQITISNHTDSLSNDERTHFFDAFFRGQTAQRKHSDGAGLGLNVAAEIVRLHHGKISLLDTPSHIVSIQVTLPLHHHTKAFN